MRPIALTIEGLTSFREPQAIDFSDLDLFVITGPTGAGKSSILDAITLALYGNVPRVNSHELRDLISHGSSYMRVSLDFEVGGQHYRVARRLGRSSHDVTLELVGNGTATPELDRGGVRVVNDRLEEIIGLDFNAFTKAVLLPQGAFADFLKGDPRERRRILMRLLDLGRYERAGQAARREATRLQAIIGERENLIESNYQHATAERLRELKAAAKDAWKEHAKVDATSQQAKELVEQTAAASANAKTLSQGVEKLDEVVQRLGELAQAWPPLELEENKATEAVAQAEKTVIDAEKRQAQAQKALEATVRKTGDAATLALLEEAAAALTREQAALTRLDEEQAQLRESIQGLEKAQDAAAAAEKAARKTVTESAAGIERAEKEKGLAQALHTCAQRAANATERERECADAQKAADASRAPAEEARAQLRHLEQEHAAIALRADLSPGDECPVCGETIQATPASAKDVEKQLAAARKSSADASEGESKAQEALAAAQAQLAAATKELEDAKKLLPAGTAIPSVADATRAARAAEATAANARKAEQNAQKTLELTAQQLSGVKNELAKTQERANGLIKTRDAANERRSTAEATLSAAFGARLPNDLPAAIGARREQLDAADSAHAAATAELNDSRRTLEAVRETLAGTSQKLARFDSESSAARTAAQLACEGLAEALEEKKLPPFPRDEPARDKLLSASSATCAKYREAAEHAIDRLEHEQQDIAPSSEARKRHRHRTGSR